MDRPCFSFPSSRRGASCCSLSFFNSLVLVVVYFDPLGLLAQGAKWCVCVFGVCYKSPSNAF